MTTSGSQVNIYQLSGLDECERGFTRQVECIHQENDNHVVFRYERVKVEGRSPTNESSALQNLISALQAQGYTQLRSQLIFRGKTYLGSQEFWVDYKDPETPHTQKPTLIKRIREWVNKKKQLKRRNKILHQF